MKRKHSLIRLLALTISLALVGQAAAQTDEEHDFSSKQMRGVKQITIDVDLDGAVKRLSKGVQFPTISNQDRSDFDTEAFKGYHQHLLESYPNVHKTLKREVLGDPRPYSLLYTWKGKDPSLQPALFYAHIDVVPVPEDSRTLFRELSKMVISGVAVFWMTRTRSTPFWKRRK